MKKNCLNLMKNFKIYKIFNKIQEIFKMEILLKIDKINFYKKNEY